MCRNINDLLPHNWVCIDVSNSNCLEHILISSACPETTAVMKLLWKYASLPEISCPGKSALWFIFVRVEIGSVSNRNQQRYWIQLFGGFFKPGKEQLKDKIYEVSDCQNGSSGATQDFHLSITLLRKMVLNIFRLGFFSLCSVRKKNKMCKLYL